MSMEELKNKIKDELLISSVISHYIPLKRQGASLVGLCPFHSDSKPSMHVSDAKRLFKCFACDASGDSIGFVMRHRNLDFLEAMKEIADKHGLHYETYQKEKKVDPREEMAKKILTKSTLVYRKMAESKAFPPFVEFLNKRHLSEDVATTYMLGFAPNKSSITEYLNSIPSTSEKEFALSVAEEIGLIKKDKLNPKSHYDTFRDRIIFPIWDQNGQVIGYTSRSIREGQNPKYLNSPESKVFNKRNLLYGLHLAKTSIREKDFAILVEGNMDQIALYKSGFQNSVAVMGVALGQSSLDRLVGLTKNFYLALDSDNAGFMAMERINRQFLEKGLLPKALSFLPEKDPDEFISAHGPIAFQNLLDTAPVALDILIDRLIPNDLPEILDRKLVILRKCFEQLAPLKMHLEATERIAQIAKRLKLSSDVSQITKNYEDFLKGIRPTFKEEIKETPKAKVVPELAISQEESKEKILEDALEVKLSKGERILLQELVQHPDALGMEEIGEVLDLVQKDEVKRYVAKLRQLIWEIDESEYVNIIQDLTLGDEYSEDLQQAVSSALFNFRPVHLEKKNLLRFIFDIKQRLMEEDLKAKKEEIKRRQAECESENELHQLLYQLSEVDKQLAQLKKNKPEKS